jgi:hypothetical protein
LTYDGPGPGSMLRDQSLHAFDCIPLSLEESFHA